MSFKESYITISNKKHNIKLGFIDPKSRGGEILLARIKS
jgi:hypothetical protein